MDPPDAEEMKPLTGPTRCESPCYRAMRLPEGHRRTYHNHRLPDRHRMHPVHDRLGILHGYGEWLPADAYRSDSRAIPIVSNAEAREEGWGE